MAAPATAVRRSTAGAASAETLITSYDVTATYAHWGRRREAAGLAVFDEDEFVAAGIGPPTELVHLACAPDAHAGGAVMAALGALSGTHVTDCLPGPHPPCCLC
jgi:hypothetical protein